MTVFRGQTTRRGTGRFTRACRALALLVGAWMSLPACAGDHLIDHWGTADGLPVNAINRLHVGSSGYLWLATFDGLVRFDGHRFTTFDAADHPAMSSNRVLDVVETADGLLWLHVDPGTLVSYDGHSLRRHGVADGLPDALVWGLQVDGRGGLWIFTDRGGIARRIDTHRFEPMHDEMTPMRLGLVGGSPDDEDWIDAAHGVYPLDGHRVLRRFERADGLPDAFSHLEWDATTGQWMAGAGKAHVMGQSPTYRLEIADGIVALLGSTSELTLHPDGRHETRERSPAYTAFGHERLFLRGTDGSLWRNRLDRIERNGRTVLNTRCKINAFEMDRSGGMWVATACDGIYRLRERRIAAVTHVQERPLGAVYGLAEDRHGRLWMATLDHGVAVIDHTGAGHWLDEANIPRDLHTLFIGHADEVRIGRCLLLPTGRCQQPDDLPEHLGLNHMAAVLGSRNPDWRTQARQLQVNRVGAFLQSRDGSLWLGSGGLWRQQPGHPWTHEPALTELTAPGTAGFIRTLLETADGSLWLGTLGDGVKRRTPDGRWQRFGMEQGLSSLSVRALRQDRDGQLWIATENRGLCRLQEAGSVSRITCLGRDRGLWSNSLHQIIFDDDERLWINSNHGIFAVPRAALDAVLDGHSARVHPQVFGESDGVPDREGNGGVHDAGIRLSDGRIAFPTQNGVALFHPRDLSPTTTPPHARFETLTRPGHPAQPVAGTTVLPRGERSLVLHYTGLSPNPTAPVYFRYRIGQQDAWTDVGNARQLNLDHLTAGSHRIELQAFGSSGHPGASAWLTMEVPPYWHETPTFRTVLITLLALGVVALMLGQRHMARRRHTQLEATVAARTEDLRGALEENERLASSKTRFFANVSHELRTPLTLLVGPLDDLARGNPPALELADAMARNAHRLDRLIGQLLDLERVQANRFPLRPEVVDLAGLAREALTAFTPLAQNERIALESDVSDSPVTVCGDAEQLMRVIGNLLSNALKFCPAQGRVRLSLANQAKGGSVLRVEDSGPGVPPEWRESIFDRFSQMGSAATRPREGAGLGLALCREVAQLHGGRLYASDSALGGACLVFELPAPDASPLAQQCVSNTHRAAPPAEHGLTPVLRQTPTCDTTRDDVPPTPNAQSNDSPLLLLAEDNPDLRTYLITILAEHYRVISAEDGEIALALAQAEAPDLIVTDLMMPNRDGLGLAQAIRSDPELSGVPIIFLTARASDADRVAGLAGGADYYLTKPFDSSVLLAQLDAALRACWRLKEHYAAHLAPDAEAQDAADGKESSPQSERSAFQSRLWEVIEMHFHDPELDVAALARRLHMSQATLRRHCQSELDTGPGDLLRQHRLECARRLLRQGAGNVSEVAYAVGYARLASFSRAYREHFGHPPGSS